MIDIHSSPEANMIRLINTRMKPNYPALQEGDVTFTGMTAVSDYYRNTRITVVGQNGITNSKDFYYLRVDANQNMPDVPRQHDLNQDQTEESWVDEVCEKFSLMKSEFNYTWNKPAAGASSTINFVAKSTSMLYIGAISITLVNKGLPTFDDIYPSNGRIITVLRPSSTHDPREWVPYAEPQGNMKVIFETYYPEFAGKGFEYKFSVSGGNSEHTALTVEGTKNITGRKQYPLTRLDSTIYKKTTFGTTSNPIYFILPASNAQQAQEDYNNWFYNNWPTGTNRAQFSTTGVYPTRYGELGSRGWFPATGANLFLWGQNTYIYRGD